jgi:hypothetical protein
VADGFGESTMKVRFMNNRDVGFLLAWDFSFSFSCFCLVFFMGLFVCGFSMGLLKNADDAFFLFLCGGCHTTVTVS